jgi:hypothetical protein
MVEVVAWYRLHQLVEAFTVEAQNRYLESKRK